MTQEVEEAERHAPSHGHCQNIHGKNVASCVPVIQCFFLFFKKTKVQAHFCAEVEQVCISSKRRKKCSSCSKILDFLMTWQGEKEGSI